MEKVAIILSSYYGSKYIKEAIDSVKKQTFKDWLLMIVDDSNGNDGLAKYIDYSKNIHLMMTDDIGLSGCRNVGAAVTQSRFIMFLDADDKLHPEYLAKTVATLVNNPDVAIAYTDTQHFGESDSYWVSPEYNFINLLNSNFMCSSSLMRRSAFDACGGYDRDNFNYWEDYEFWIKMGSKGFYGKHIPEKLFYYRMHKDSGTQSARDKYLAPVYKAYIISKFPYIYPRFMYDEALRLLKELPSDFMKWKPKEQEKYLKERGLIH